MSTNSALKHKVARWRSYLNDALDYYERTGQEIDGRAGDPVQNFWAVTYLGTLANIMRKDMGETAKRLAFALASTGTHKDTLDANSFRAAAQAIDNIHSLNGEVQRELQKQDARALYYGRPAMAPPPIKQITPPPPPPSSEPPSSWEPESEEEPTHPGVRHGPPVIFGD